MGPVTQTNQNTNDAGGFSSSTDIAINSSNRYAVVWNRRVNFGTNIQSVFLRIYNSNGTPATNEINVVGDKDINSPQVGMDNAGNVYVMYDDKVSSSGTNYYLKIKKYSSTGSLLNTTTVEQIDQSCQYDVAVMPNGRVIAFYTNTSNQLRLRVYNSSLGLQGTTTIQSGTRYYTHHIDERDGVVAIAYTRDGATRVRKYSVNSSSFSLLNAITITGGLSYDPIALREDGQVGLLISSGSTTTYQLRSSNLLFSNSTALPNSTFSLNAGIDTDEDDNTYILWNNNAGGTDGRIYNASNSITGSFTHGFSTSGSTFWAPAVATFDCRFVASARYQSGSTLKINHRRWTCEDCNFNTNFSYTLTCLGSTVQINVTASQNNTSSQYNLYQVSTPSTSDPLGPVIDQFTGNSGSFTVPNVVGTHYVIKHGNWSADCPWRETRKLITIPQFNNRLEACFNYSVTGSSKATTFNLNLFPCVNSGSTSHWWYLYRSSSQNGPFTFVSATSSSNNSGVSFTGLDKGYFYRVLHYVDGPCSWWQSSQQTFYVNFFGAIQESGPATFKQGEAPDDEALRQDQVTPIKVELWPNPAREHINLSWEGLASDMDVDVDIYNAQGQIIRRESIGAGYSQTELSTNDLSNGLYFLTIRQGEQTLEKKKFTVQR